MRRFTERPSQKPKFKNKSIGSFFDFRFPIFNIRFPIVLIRVELGIAGRQPNAEIVYSDQAQENCGLPQKA